MKARIPTKHEIEAKLTLEEILRINKLWVYVVARSTRITRERLHEICKDVYKLADDIYEDPELWLRVDELLLDKLEFTDIFTPENYSEREEVARLKHRENHKKWRV